jgi:hypothetical protein
MFAIMSNRRSSLGGTASTTPARFFPGLQLEPEFLTTGLRESLLGQLTVGREAPLPLAVLLVS